MNLTTSLSWPEITYLLVGTAVALVVISWLSSSGWLWIVIGLLLLIDFVIAVLNLRLSFRR